MKTYVISVGGSLIIPNKVDYNFLIKLKKSINKLNKKYKIVIVTGGGKTARTYIEPLKKAGFNNEVQSLLGIKSTQLNAMLVSNFMKANKLLPNSLIEIKNLLKRTNLVVTGSIGFKPNMTSDGDSADIARYLNAEAMINMTDVDGLFTKNPKQFRDAKFIPDISFNKFSEIANKIKFKAGQHFVLDQSAAKIIKKYGVKTVILKGVDNMEKFVEGKNFKGTIISN